MPQASMEKSFECPDCHTKISGTNCAHELSRQIEWKNKPNCVTMCPCRYPVRAKELRDHVFTGFLDDNREATDNAYIYCAIKVEGSDHENGHVYYGTFENCVQGNGRSASKMSACHVFKRYSGYK